MDSFNFLTIMEGTSVHRPVWALDKSVHSGGHIRRFLSRGVLHIGLCGEAPSERGFFRLQI